MTKFTRTFFVGMSVALLSVVLLWAQTRIQRPTNPQTGYSAGVSYSSGGNPTTQLFNGEVNIVTDQGADAGPIVRVYDGVNAAWQHIAGEYGVGEFITFEGATADAFETILTVQDPTVGDGTFQLPDNAAAAATYNIMFSTLATNALDVANSVWGGTNQLVFESTVADGFEYVFEPAALTGDVTITLPSDNADWAGTGAPMYSVLLTNAPDIANGVWGVSNGIHFEGATADAFENSIQSDDPTVADAVFDLPNNAAAGPFNLMFSDLDTNALDVADSVWGTTNGIVWEGATGADAFETTLIAQDPDVDVLYQMPNKGVTGTFNLLDAGQAPIVTAEVMNREDGVSVPGAPRFKTWFRSMPVYTAAAPTTAGGFAACSTTGNPNWILGPSVVGYGYELDAKGTVTVCGNDYVAADGMGLHSDAAANEGHELTQGIVDGSPGAFTIGTSPAFSFRVRFAIGTVANTDQTYAGLRLAQPYEDAVMGNYTDSYTIGVGDLADGGAGDFYCRSILNGAGAVNTDIAEADWTDNQVHTIEVRVSAAGVATSYIEGVLVGDAQAFTFDNGDVVVPYLWFLSDVTGADPDIDIVFWETGIQ